MSIKQNGGVFGRNPTFNDVTIEGDLIINGEVFTGLDFQGSWNASTNSPALASSVGTNGEFYIVSVAGTTDLNGITNWGIGDWAIFNGTVWQRVEGGADGNFNDVTVAGTLGVAGDYSSTTLGTSNLRLGVNAGNSIVSSGNYNVVVGDEAGTAITTGNSNVAVGYLALDANTTADNNTAVGKSALTANITGTQNTAVGAQTLFVNTTGNYNVAVGVNTLSANTTGTQNVALGAYSLDANTTASNNTAFGTYALGANTTGTQNVALGAYALDANTTASNNTAVGHQSLGANTTGTNNIAVGTNALDANTTGANNISVGINALGANTTASNNTAVGYNSLTTNTTGTKNVCIGYGAGDAITTGSNNTIIGDYAGTAALADTIVLASGTTERMRIDSSGSVGIGTSSPSATLNVQKPTGDGEIFRLRGGVYTNPIYAGGLSVTTVGDISNSNRYWKANCHTDSLAFSKHITNTDAISGAVTSITATGIAFNGDTGAANSLDDYEEGTWSPTIVGSTSGSITGFTVSDATYTKIGDTVRLSCYLSNIDMTSSTVSGQIKIGGLPFSSDSFADVAAVTHCTMFSFDESTTSVSGYLSGSDVLLRKGSSVIAITDADEYSLATAQIMLSVTYKVA